MVQLEIQTCDASTCLHRPDCLLACRDTQPLRSIRTSGGHPCISFCGPLLLSPHCSFPAPPLLARPTSRVPCGTGQSHWPTQDGTVTLPNFRFGTGETFAGTQAALPHAGHAASQCRRARRQRGAAAARHGRQCALTAESHLLRRAVRARRRCSTSRSTSSSCPTTSATAKAPSPPTACACTSPRTTTTTWCAASA